MAHNADPYDSGIDLRGNLQKTALHELQQRH